MKSCLILLFVVIVCSCSKISDPEPINGFHSLNQIFCECEPITLVPYQQQWKFDFEELQVESVVDGEVENRLLFESGIYNLEFPETINPFTGDTISRMLVNERPFNYFFHNESITLSDPGAHSDLGAYYLFVQN